MLQSKTNTEIEELEHLGWLQQETLQTVQEHDCQLGLLGREQVVVVVVVVVEVCLCPYVYVCVYSYVYRYVSVCVCVCVCVNTYVECLYIYKESGSQQLFSGSLKITAGSRLC